MIPSWHLRFVWFVLVFAAAHSAIATDPSPPSYQTREMEGWTVHVREELLRDQAEATAHALDVIRGHLAQIVKDVPAPAVARLRKVVLWVSPEYSGVGPKAEYPSRYRVLTPLSG